MKNNFKTILQFFVKNGKKKILVKQLDNILYNSSKLIKYKHNTNLNSNNWIYLKMINKWFKQNKAYIFLLEKNMGKRNAKKKKINVNYKLLPLFTYKKNFMSMHWLKKEINLSQSKKSKSIYNLIFDKMKMCDQLNQWNSKYKTEHYTLVGQNLRKTFKKPYKKYVNN